MRITPQIPTESKVSMHRMEKRHEGEKVRSWVPLVLVSKLGEVGTRVAVPIFSAAKVRAQTFVIGSAKFSDVLPTRIVPEWYVSSSIAPSTGREIGRVVTGAEWSWMRSLGVCTPYHSANWFGEPQSPRCLPPQVCCMVWGKDRSAYRKADGLDVDVDVYTRAGQGKER